VGHGNGLRARSIAAGRNAYHAPPPPRNARGPRGARPVAIACATRPADNSGRRSGVPRGRAGNKFITSARPRSR